MKKMMMKNLSPIQKQSGAALIVSLVILVVITLIGSASIRTSTMEMKMVNSQRDRDASFAAAEAALVAAEEWLELNKPANSQLIDTCGAGASCFEASCSGGLCFEGEYTTGDSEFACVVGDSSGAAQPIEFWSDQTIDVWGTTSKHRTITVEGFDEEVKYIVEFLCYADDGTGGVFNAANPYEGQPIYRITALAEGNGDKAKVMLQSTYMLVES